MTKKNPFEPLKFAHRIIRDQHVHTLSTGRGASLLSYDFNSDLFRLDDRPIEVAAQRDYLTDQGSRPPDKQSPVMNHHIQEIVNAVRRNAPQVGAEELNDPSKEVIHFKNGVFNLQTLVLEPHSPDHLYTIGIPHSYNPFASCPAFDKFLSQILKPAERVLVDELLGYLLIPSTRFRKLFIFLGAGTNGKSVLVLAMEAILGARNVSHQSLHHLAHRHFSVAQLFGKLLNCHSDLDTGDVYVSGLLKQLASGDSLDVEKKFKDPFSTPVTARSFLQPMRSLSSETEARL